MKRNEIERRAAKVRKAYSVAAIVGNEVVAVDGDEAEPARGTANLPQDATLGLEVQTIARSVGCRPVEGGAAWTWEG